MLVVSDVLSMDVLVDLVNGWGTGPRTAAEEQSLPFPEQSGLTDRFAVPAQVKAPMTAAALRRLADRVYPIFEATDSDVRASLVMGLMDESGARPTLVARDDRVLEAWTVTNARQLLLAAAAVALRRQLIDRPPGRLGVCDGVKCADAYVDASPAGHRRYCSLTCQNRNRVAAFRRRAAGKSIAETGQGA